MAGLAVVLFIWMYIRTALQLQTTGKEQLKRLQNSLMLYSRVTGPLGEMMEHEDHSLEEISQLITLLEECKAAPLLTSDLHEQIDAYIRERDLSRLSILYKSWVREVNQRIEEQSTLLRKWDRPSWGVSFWVLLKPALPFVAVVAIVVWSLQLYQTLIELPSFASSPLEIVNAWARFISCMIATGSLYLVFMYTRRLPHHLIYTTLYVLISAVAVFHGLGLSVALYIVGVQALLYIAGFSLTTKRTRRDRPYAGRDLVLEIEPSSMEEEKLSYPSSTHEPELLELPTRSKRKHNK